MNVFQMTDSGSLEATGDTVLVLGYFDGLHLGHQQLFKTARDLANQLNSRVAVLTFPESPKLAFARFEPELLLHLNSPAERLKRFEELGVDDLYLVDFTGVFAQGSAETFVNDYLKRLSVKAVVAGFDYRFGKDQKTAEDLKDLLECPVYIVPEQQLVGEKISSSRIRQGLKAGLIAEVNQLLGYAYTTRGMVVHGDARGRTIGYPTANLALLDRVYLPGDGVYVAEVVLDGQTYRAMASVGKNVTFDGTELRVEVHVLDFEGNLYGQVMSVRWLAKLRDMVKFSSVEELIQQLQEDERMARSFAAQSHKKV